MATPTLGSPPTTINAADVNTNWLITVTADSEFKKEGTNSMSGTLRNDLSTCQYGPVTGISMASQHMRCWINFGALPYLDTEAGSGMEFWVTDGTNTAYWIVFGSDTYFGGWKNVIVNFEGTPSSGTKPTGSVTTWGFRFNRTAAPANKINTWVDALRYGNGYVITGGTSGDKVTLDNIYTVDKASAYGVVDKVEGVFFGYGKLTFGNGATTTYINITGQVLVFTNSRVATGLYALIGQGAGCDITISASVFNSSGTTDTTRYAIDMDDANLAALSMTANFITRAAACTFKSGQTVTGNTFDNCGQITPAGANLSGSTVKGYAGTADTAALVWDVNTDPDGLLDNIVFTKGSAAAHAIQLGLTSPTTINLNGITFASYNAANSQNDSAILVSRTTGTVTIYANGCTGTVSYKSAGAAVEIIQDSVAFSVTVKDTAVPPVVINNALVLVLASDDTGPMPYNETVTSITNVGTTATVAHTGHGMLTNDKVQITGASLWQNNGVFSITRTNDNEYTYTLPSAPGSSPTGTIKATYAALYGLTSSGVVSSSRVFTTDQPIIGRARKYGTSPPYYQTANFTGIIDSVTGFAVTVQLLPDA